MIRNGRAQVIIRVLVGCGKGGDSLVRPGWIGWMGLVAKERQMGFSKPKCRYASLIDTWMFGEVRYDKMDGNRGR